MDEGIRTVSSVNISIESEYLVSSARIRNISVSRLVTILMDHICEDQLVNSILDDDDGAETRKKVASGQIRSRKKQSGPVLPSQTRSNLRPTRAAAVPYRSIKIQPTREELRRETQQAILNTGGKLADEDPPSACPPPVSPVSSQTAVPSPEVDISDAKQKTAIYLHKTYGYPMVTAMALAGVEQKETAE